MRTFDSRVTDSLLKRLPRSATSGVKLDAESRESLPGSPDLRRIEHPEYGSWLSFRKTLRPRYGVVWAEIAGCIAMALGSFAAHLTITIHKGNAFGLEIGLPFAVWIGFWLNAILTFGHEAAHYNLAPDHNSNDLLADWTIWLFFPQTTHAYRRSHWQHHLHLGDPNDTEISYHNCLSPWFLAKTLTGIHLAGLLARYILGRRATSGKIVSVTSKVGVAPLLRTLSIYGLIMGSALALRCYASALVWFVAAAVVFPFFASVRQLLEHRTAEAACDTDFQEVVHGPVNRIFGNDLFSRYFGAAGFNRHLLHHWDPTVSYTCFDEMQRFFAGTEFREEIERSQASYCATALVLFRRSRDGGR